MDTNLKKYCSYCGRTMREISQGAEEFYYCYESGASYPYSKYNRATGKRQIVKGFACPQFQYEAEAGRLRVKIFGSKHDNYFDDKVIDTD